MGASSIIGLTQNKEEFSGTQNELGVLGLRAVEIG